MSVADCRRCTLRACICCLLLFAQSSSGDFLTPPSLTNNPSKDVVATSPRPLLSVFNSRGGVGPLTCTFEISKQPDFPASDTVRYEGISASTPFITEKQVEAKDALQDGCYYWRALSTDSQGTKSAWSSTRFHVDYAGSRSGSGLLRAPVASVSVSSGQDPKNVVDWNDQGQATYWNSSPAAKEILEWVVLDMGKPQPVCRLWMLSNTLGDWGWLTDFVWQSSPDGRSWTEIPNNRAQGKRYPSQHHRLCTGQCTLLSPGHHRPPRFAGPTERPSFPTCVGLLYRRLCQIRTTCS